MKIKVLLSLSLFLCVSCGIQPQKKQREVAFRVSISGKPLANSAVIVFPEGFDQYTRENKKDFLMLTADENGYVRFLGSEQVYFVVAGNDSVVVSGTVLSQNGTWNQIFTADNSEGVLKISQKAASEGGVFVCHQAWCRWKFCQYCCEYAGVKQCRHYFKPGWDK